ncbi:MAG: hypothetical protein DI556_18320 [Rhodovulum sulfidophilum]|uniref:Uncharacterized protein n=1 Tax=Rhodovulum sulfidophilum TaxID=35806 RepID=A0A2W5N0Y7_RHOSU|nr:MAG: hypothetical protein DI556_18320 [Rhodovulum sulfidophilum]
MRISKALAASALLLVLAACEQPGVSGSTPTQTTVTAGGQRVTILAPAGFCVDQRSTSVTSTGAFVMVSDCALVGDTRAPRAAAAAHPGDAAPAPEQAAAAKPPIGAALTASVSPTGLGQMTAATRSLHDLAAYAKTPPGLAVVARSGQSQGVRVLESAERGGVLYLYVEDRGPQPIAGLEPRFWRAFFEVNGRLTAVSELAFADGGLDKQSGLNLVTAFVNAIKAANPPAAAATAQPAPASGRPAG